MKRREFITTTAVALTSSVAFAQSANQAEEMHAPRYKAIEETALKCVGTGEDCLRHGFGMWSMKDTTMATCTEAVQELVAVCRALHTLAALNSPFTADLARTATSVCDAAEKECRKFYTKYVECKECADSCHQCADACRKLTAK